MKVKLYIIVNDVNNKVYIGQTIQTLQNRFNGHIIDAINKDGNINKFHSSLLRIGINHFSIRLIGEFDIEEIDNKEIEYIAKYDSYYNGYNSTLGGHTGNRFEYDNDWIINQYKEGKSITKIMKEMGLNNNRYISKLIKDKGIEVRTCRKKVLSIDKHGNIIEYYSVTDAYNNIMLNSNRIIKFTNFSYLINKSYKHGTTAYGYKWAFSMEDATIIAEKNDKITEKNDKIAFKEIDKNKNKVEYKCKNCNKIISRQSKTGLCNSCANVEAKGKSPKPSRQQLLIDYQTMNKQQIADKYGRTKSTICYWFKQYNI